MDCGFGFSMLAFLLFALMMAFLTSMRRLEEKIGTNRSEQEHIFSECHAYVSCDVELGTYRLVCDLTPFIGASPGWTIFNELNVILGTNAESLIFSYPRRFFLLKFGEIRFEIKSNDILKIFEIEKDEKKGINLKFSGKTLPEIANETKVKPFIHSYGSLTQV